MTLSDIEKVIKIEQECFDDPWIEEQFYFDVEKSGSYILENLQKSQLIGYLCGYMVLDEYHLTNIAVRIDEQKRGYGYLLLELVKTELMKQGCKKSFLEVRESNIKAISLYCKAGYTIIGKRKAYYYHPVEDAVVMMLELYGTKSLADQEHLFNTKNGCKKI